MVENRAARKVSYAFHESLTRAIMERFPQKEQPHPHRGRSAKGAGDDRTR